MIIPIIWLRAEAKRRASATLYSPAWVQERVEQGSKVYVEKGNHRSFDDADYEEAGAILIPKEGSRLAKPGDIIY